MNVLVNVLWTTDECFLHSQELSDQRGEGGEGEFINTLKRWEDLPMAQSMQEVTSCSPGAEYWPEKGRVVSKAGENSRGLDSMWKCVSLCQMSKLDRSKKCHCSCARRYTRFQYSPHLSISEKKHSSHIINLEFFKFFFAIHCLLFTVFVLHSIQNKSLTWEACIITTLNNNTIPITVSWGYHKQDRNLQSVILYIYISAEYTQNRYLIILLSKYFIPKIQSN